MSDSDGGSSRYQTIGVTDAQRFLVVAAFPFVKQAGF